MPWKDVSTISIFGILLLDEQIARMRLTVDLLRSNLDKIRACFRNGVAMTADVDAVEAELLAANQQTAEYEARRENYRRMLALFIGEELDDRPLVRPAVVAESSAAGIGLGIPGVASDCRSLRNPGMRRESDR